MGFQQFQRRMGTHLAGDDTQQVVLDTEHIDGRQFAVLDNEVEGAFEGLILLAFPVEAHADGHRLQGKRGVLGIYRLKQQVVVAVAVPLDLTVDTACRMVAAAGGTIHAVVTIEHEVNRRLVHDAHPHLRYLFLVHNILFLVVFYIKRTIRWVGGFPNAGRNL